jgi:membrane-associated phospholipid phosphatase
MSVAFKLVISFVVLLLLTTGFFGLDALLSGKKVHDVACRFDERIPLRPRWIWAYLLYYPLCAAPLLFPGVLENDATFLRVLAGLLLQFFVAWPIFWFLPTRMIHPDLPDRTLSAFALRLLYRVDAGYNVFPSLHIANSVYVACVAIRFVPLPVSILLWIVTLLIAASTVLIKQHYLIDAPAGALLGLAAYLLLF